ncbi:MAG: hypothetical protein LBS27_07420 [Bifidobacteriaceae bacterium]|jgi:hypothetical protein|nr:hypothetical protein [Bifidobacteriaceae bacterium]
MADWSDFDQASAALDDPALAPDDLATIADLWPELWERLVTHPSAYPELVAWLGEQGVAAAGEAGGTSSSLHLPPELQSPWVPAARSGPEIPSSPQSRSAGSGPMPPGSVAPPHAFWPGMAQAPLRGPGGQAPWTGPPALYSPPKAAMKRGRLAAIIAIAVIVLGGGVAGIWALNGGDRIALVRNGSRVSLDDGETPYRGSVTLDGEVQAEVGFVLSADGKTLHHVSTRLEGGVLRREYGLGWTTHTDATRFDIIDGKVVADISSDGELEVLELTFDGIMAGGTFTCRREFGESDTRVGEMVDLGTAQVVVSPLED